MKAADSQAMRAAFKAWGVDVLRGVESAFRGYCAGLESAGAAPDTAATAAAWADRAPKGEA